MILPQKKPRALLRRLLKLNYKRIYLDKSTKFIYITRATKDSIFVIIQITNMEAL